MNEDENKPTEVYTDGVKAVTDCFQAAATSLGDTTKILNDSGIPVLSILIGVATGLAAAAISFLTLEK